MLIVTDLSFSYTDRPLFKNANFRISPGQKVGLVGPNGAGKTTLLSLLLGKGGQSGGTVKHQGTIGYVPQEIKRDEVMQKAHSVRLYIDPENEYQDHELKQFLSHLECTAQLTEAPQKLSGGQKTKIALTRALLMHPDILLLDEPTNFLDIEGKKWLMKFLSNFKGTVICISHDLDLMDHAIDKVLAVNPITTTIEEYTGNYTSYLRLKEESEKKLKKDILIKQKHIKQMEQGLINMARFTSDKGVRKRTLQKRRIEKEKEDLPQMPQELRTIKLSLPLPQKVGELPLRAINISKAYGQLKVLDSINFSIARGERVVLIGPNGAGKSTFIKILMGILAPDNGEVIRNESLSVGYYSQEFERFDLSLQVIEMFMKETHQPESFARPFLGKYNFLGNKVFQKIETLSGGEKTRLAIACLTAKSHNLLVLDEPTTYLDVLSQRIILEALKGYTGAMIIVSHTPEFIEELVPARALLFPEQKIVFWEKDLVRKVEEV